MKLKRLNKKLLERIGEVSIETLTTTCYLSEKEMSGEDKLLGAISGAFDPSALIKEFGTYDVKYIYIHNRNTIGVELRFNFEAYKKMCNFVDQHSDYYKFSVRVKNVDVDVASI